MDWPLKIQGRFLTELTVNEICALLKEYPNWNRSRLSRELCELWNWRRPDGQLKDMACRELLRKLESRFLIKLPPRQRPGPGRAPIIEPVKVDKRPVDCSFSGLKPVRIIDARISTEHEKTFNYLVKEYHYLSYGRPVGQNMKYLIFGANDHVLGCLLFGAAAWKSADRDQWIGWTAEIREQNLGLICNNTRFLLLPWVNVFNLASYALGAALRRLSEDWKHRYGQEIALVETFVDTTRYLGTCYKAANWQKIGQTKGRSRQDRYSKLKVPIKDIWVFPLQRNFRDVLYRQ
ncbi:Druantia anti-phage system protein DruA [Desulfobacula sp.]